MQESRTQLPDERRRVPTTDRVALPEAVVESLGHSWHKRDILHEVVKRQATDQD